jgi:hypothetical protein
MYLSHDITWGSRIEVVIVAISNAACPRAQCVFFSEDNIT